MTFETEMADLSSSIAQNISSTVCDHVCICIYVIHKWSIGNALLVSQYMCMFTYVVVIYLVLVTISVHVLFYRDIRDFKIVILCYISQFVFNFGMKPFGLIRNKGMDVI